MDGFSLPPDVFAEIDDICSIDSTSENMLNVINSAQAIVIMSHYVERDEYFLKNALNSTAGYISLLGSTKHRDKILTSLNVDKKELGDRFHSPVGLDLGGDLPEDIALSIIAEIQQSVYVQQDEASALHGTASRAAIMDKLAVIVLAAGGSTRFSGLKQLLEYKGMSFLRRSVEMASKIIPPEQIHVVLGPKELKIQREITHASVNMISNPNWESGIASSIKAGLRGITDGYTGILFLLCDQPLISTQHIEQLIKQWENNQDKIMASSHTDICTEPAIVPDKYFPEISKLFGDQGVRQLIENQISGYIQYPDS